MTAAVGDDAVARYNFTGSAAVALLVGAVLAWATRAGATDLLVAVAAVQAMVGFVWMFVLRVPGRKGGLLIGAAAAAAADTAASVWPHSKLAAMLAVVALAAPAMFVHQLMRGAARVRVGASLGGIAVLVVVEAALPALLQLRHEFPTATLTGDATVAVIAAALGGLAAGLFTDMVVAAPRFDAAVPRGLPAVVVSAVVGAAAAHITLRSSRSFDGGRALFVGAAIGALVALVAVGVAFVEQETPLAERGFGLRSRPVLSVLVPLALVSPVGFLLCLAISR